MTEDEKKSTFLKEAAASAKGVDGNFEFTCPLCKGYAIGVRQSWFGSYRANCVCCGFTARGVIDGRKSA